ncbi:MAG: aminoacyl-tRNA hydrolase [bacterium]
MKLIVGLGNPGEEYKNTRHNLGFMAVDFLNADDFSPWKMAHGALTARGEFAGEKCLLAKPQAYMNLSGESVQQLAAWYKVEPHEIIVIHDELDLPLGEIRSKIGGGSAGHNGIKDIVEKLGTPEFHRVRLGMRTERAELVPAEKYVLEKFTAEEMKLVETELKAAVEAVRKILKTQQDPPASG